MVGFVSDEMDSLRKQLQDTEEKAKLWQHKAQKLEMDKTHLGSNLKQEWERNIKTEDKAVVTIGHLQSQRQVLNGELHRRDKGIQLWKEKEGEYRTEITYLKQRMDEMSGMIRNRDTELEKLKAKEFRYRERIDALHKDKSNQQDRRRGVTLPQLKQEAQAKAKTLPGKLPTLVQYDASVTELVRRPFTKNMNPLPAIISPRGQTKSSPLEESVVPERPKTRTHIPSGLKCSPEPDDGTLNCKMNEKWVDRNGGEIELPNVTLHIPPNSVAMPVLISVTETEFSHLRQRQIDAVGLEKYLEPHMQLRLQPHGLRFLRPVFLEMKGVNLPQSQRLLVFHKDVDPHLDPPWTDITSEASPKTRKEDVILSIDRFSILETIKLLAPVVSLAAGMAIGYKMHANSLFNNKLCAVNFYAFYKHPDPYLVVMCRGYNEEYNNNNDSGTQVSLEAGYKLIGSQSSRFPLCDKETLYFYYNNGPNLAGAFPFDFEKCQTKGQRFHVPLSSIKNGILPKAVFVRRRVANHLSEEELCDIHIRDRRDPPLSTTIEEQYEKIIRKYRMELISNVDVSNVIDFLQAENIINISEKEEIMYEKTTRARVGKLLDMVHAKGLVAFKIFCISLEQDYYYLSEQLWKEFQDHSSTSTYSMSVT